MIGDCYPRGGPRPRVRYPEYRGEVPAGRTGGQWTSLHCRHEPSTDPSTDAQSDLGMWKEQRSESDCLSSPLGPGRVAHTQRLLLDCDNHCGAHLPTYEKVPTYLGRFGRNRQVGSQGCRWCLVRSLSVVQHKQWWCITNAAAPAPSASHPSARSGETSRGLVRYHAELMIDIAASSQQQAVTSIFPDRSCDDKFFQGCPRPYAVE